METSSSLEFCLFFCAHKLAESTFATLQKIDHTIERGAALWAVWPEDRLTIDDLAIP